jgi:DNA gyrase subunit A
LLVGLSVAVANIDDIIALIKAAPSPKDAKEQLIAKAWPLFDLAPIITLIEPDFSVSSTTYTLSALQAQAILDMRLHRLTGLEREKLQADLRDIVAKIEDLMTLLRHRDQLLALMKSEMLVIKEKYGTPRRTEIVEDTGEVNIEDLIQREDMVVTMTHHGYIKRVPLSAYRAQKRGGKGRSGMDTKTDDFVSTVHIASTHTPLLFFSNLGKVYYLKVYNLPSTTPQARGRPIVQMLSNIQPHERISAVLPLPESVEPDDQRTMVFATSSGNVRRNRLSDFTNIKANGKIAMKLDDGDLLVGVAIVEHDEDVFLATKEGKCIRFGMDELRVFESRNSSGVRGVRLADSDRVISLSLLKRCDFTMEEREAYRIEQAKLSGQELANPDNLSLSTERFAAMQAEEEFILTVSDQGFGKRSSAYEYRRTGRGGMGIAAMEMTKKTGKMADAFPIKNDDQIMLVTDQGQMIRCGVADVRIAGRKTQGVTLFKVSTGEHVVSVGHMAGEDDDGEEGKS